MKNLKQYIIVLLCAFCMSSCNDWLQVSPENAISSEELFATGFGFRNSLNGIYTTLASSDLYGRELSWGFLSAISQEYNQSDATQSPLYEDASILLYNSQQTEPIVRNIWEKSYKVLANINKLIDNIQKTDPLLFEYKEDEKDLIYAEALALRAYVNFDLLRLFAPAPITNPTGTYLSYRNEYSQFAQEKLTVKAFLEKVMNDVKTAEPILKKFDTDTHPNAMYASGMYEPNTLMNARYRFCSSLYVDQMGIFFWSRGYRMNYLGLLGFKARLYMYAGADYYDMALTAANELYTKFYNDSKWVGFTEEENITCPNDRRHTKCADDVLFGLYQKNLAPDYVSSVWRTSSTTATTRLPLANVDYFFASDHIGVYTDYRVDYLIGKTNETRSKYFSLKYNTSTESLVSEMENPMIPMIRFSEVCHILAEIACSKNKISEGIRYLEIVRNARGASRSLSLTVKTQDDLMKEIMLDIYKEGIAEGGLFFTYKRLNQPYVPSSQEDGMIDMSNSYILPLPTSESIN